MLHANQLPGILPISGGGIDERSQYYYEISGKVSMKAMYEKARMEYDDIRRFMNALLKVMKQLRAHMLDVNRLILEPEYIYYADSNYYFCYYPLQELYLCEVFHKLTEYFVSQVDYEDKEGVFLAYELHKATMEENYNIEQMNERIVNQVRNKEMPFIGKKRYEKYYSEEDWIDEEVIQEKGTSKDDIKEQENLSIEMMTKGVQILREKAEDWAPLKLLRKKMENKKR